MRKFMGLRAEAEGFGISRARDYEVACLKFKRK